MSNELERRIERLEQRQKPAPVLIVLYPGDAEPWPLPEGAQIIRVVYENAQTEGDRHANEDTDTDNAA